MKTVLALLRNMIFTVLFCNCSQKPHEKLHHELALASIASDGSCIGVAINDLRQNGKMPVKGDDVYERYKRASRGRLTVATNQNGDLEITGVAGAVWMVRPADGVARLFRTMDPDAADAVSIFWPVDFSRPMGGENILEAGPKLRSELERASDMVWSTYPGTKK